jgi:hypothetical protein
MPATYVLADSTGITVTVITTREDALDRAARLAGALRRRIDVTPATPEFVAPKVKITGWSFYPADAPAYLGGAA